MASSTTNLKGYVKTENTILMVCIALAAGFLCGVVFSAIRSMDLPGVQAPSSPQTPMSRELSEELDRLRRHTLDNPEDVAAWTNLGHRLFDAGRHEEAISAYENSLRLDGDRPDIWTDLGVMYRRYCRIATKLMCKCCREITLWAVYVKPKPFVAVLCH